MTYLAGLLRSSLPGPGLARGRDRRSTTSDNTSGPKHAGRKGALTRRTCSAAGTLWEEKIAYVHGPLLELPLKSKNLFLVACVLGVGLLATAVGAAELPCAGGWSPHASGVVTPRVEALGLDAVIRSALESVGATPGLAVGILAEGEVIYSRGFGVRKLASCQPVTPSSVFYLLSVTKSFTGMLAAVLQEEATSTTAWAR